MFRLLLALIVCGALAYWMLRPDSRHDITADRVRPMLQSLSRNGCPTPAASAAAPTDGKHLPIALQALKVQIEACEARAARRDAGERSPSGARPAP